ncbi:Asp-tRNA(Asn)/Glu-tRNA(Gln) amidotransferase subunit GatC [Patescibacteria group bacterium]|nr:Asp-tRNA(Asn)/Glu-tRNA(Gln) amidotransferase subunit GatC [Patescibacteria group bacterium]
MKVDINKLALLSRIKLNTKEKEKLQKEFGAILDYISQLKEVDIEGIDEKEASQITRLENILRKDENGHKGAEFSEDLLRESPKKENSYIKVKHILK